MCTHGQLQLGFKMSLVSKTVEDIWDTRIFKWPGRPLRMGKVTLTSAFSISTSSAHANHNSWSQIHVSNLNSHQFLAHNLVWSLSRPWMCLKISTPWFQACLLKEERSETYMFQELWEDYGIYFLDELRPLHTPLNCSTRIQFLVYFQKPIQTA